MNYAWWDIVRLHYNLKLLLKNKHPVVHIDIDLIIEKDIEQIVNLPYDIIISKEIGEDKAYPPEYSKILGFGVCSGFYIIKNTSTTFLLKILALMKDNQNTNYSDQVNIMKYIVESNDYKINEENVVLDNINYTNKIIYLKSDNIKICVLDFNIIIRDPIINNNQFGNHINIDNVGGTQNLIKYFYEDLEKLPLTCRCGKTHLGNFKVCTHKR